MNNPRSYRQALIAAARVVRAFALTTNFYSRSMAAPPRERMDEVVDVTSRNVVDSATEAELAACFAAGAISKF